MKLRRSSSVDSLQLNSSSIPSTTMLAMVATTSSPVNTTSSNTTTNSNNGSSFSTSSNNSEDQQQRRQQQEHQSSTSSSSPPPPPMATFKCDHHHHNHNNGGGGVDSMTPRLVPSELENMVSTNAAAAAITNIASNHHHYYNYYYFNNKTYCGRSMIDQTTQTPEDWKTTNCSIIAATVHHHHHHHSSLVIDQQQQQCCYNSNGICIDGTYLEHHHQKPTTTTPTLNNPDSTDSEQSNVSTVAKTRETFLNNKTAAAAITSPSVSVNNCQNQSWMFQQQQKQQSNIQDSMDKKIKHQNPTTFSVNSNNDVAAGSGSVDGSVVGCCDFYSGDSSSVGGKDSQRILCCCCHHHHRRQQPYLNQQQHYEKTNQFRTTTAKKSNHPDYFGLVDVDNDARNGIRNVNNNHHHDPDLGNGNNKNVDDNEHPSTTTTTKIVETETAMTTSTDDNNDNNGPIDSIAATTTTEAVSAVVPNTQTIMVNDKRCYYYWKPSCENNINTTTANTDASVAAVDVASVLESSSPVSDANLSRLNSNVDRQYKLAMITKEKNPIISNNNDHHQQNPKKNQNDENDRLNCNSIDIHKLKSNVTSTNKNFNDDDFGHYPRTLKMNHNQMDVVENPRILNEIINTDNDKVGCCAINNSTVNDDDGTSLILGDLELDQNDDDNNQENDQNLFNNFQQKSNQLRTKMIMMLMMNPNNPNNHGDRKTGRICKSESGANDSLIAKCRNDYSNDNNITMAVRSNNSNNTKPNVTTIPSIPSTAVNIKKINSNHNQGINDIVGNLELLKNGDDENKDDLEANMMTDSSCRGVGGISCSNKIPKSMPITIPMKSTNQQLFGFFGAYHSIDVNNNNNVNNQPIVPSGQHHQTGILSTVTNNINNSNTIAVPTNHNIHNINILSSNSIEEFNQEIAELMEKNQIEYKDNDNDHNHYDGCDDNDHDGDDHRARSKNGAGNGNPTSSSFSIITNHHHHNNNNSNGGRRAPVNELMLIAGVGDSSSSSTSYLDGRIVIVDDVAGVDDIDDIDDYRGSNKMIAKNMDNTDSGWHDDHWSIDQTCMPFLCDDVDVDDHYDDNKNDSSSVAVDINEDNGLTSNNINDDQGEIGGVPINRFISTHKRVLDETDIDQWLSDQEQQPRRPLTTILANHKMKDINQGQVKVKSKQKLVLSLTEDLNHQQHNGTSSKFAKLNYNADNKQQQQGWNNSSQMLPSPKMISSDLIDNKIFKFGTNNEGHSSTMKTTSSNKPKSSKPTTINSINEILSEADFTMTNNFFMEFNSRQHHQHSNTSTTSSTKDTSFKLKPSFQSAFLPVSELMTSNTRWMQASN